MPTYIAKERGQIPVNDVQPVRRPEAEGRRVVFRIVEPGEKFEFNGKPGSWMEPVDKDEKGTPRPKASGARATNSTSNDTSGGQDDPGAP
ncbi:MULTISPECIES: hypothetical protein [unclassified Caballeronia]|uniref:hypothetical protein n=1 Tax=unclassified Caballeronia TaxID=2646786 RepID=UPI001F3151F1|nr:MULTISPECIES: hypothetical protein [unclassified Caballeronia]MCE4544597.1 hypothetical protein [Caballeronia sp. PC1]MCE4571749.1 hypothetical protein [Caballeronia sp. CLC5]